METLNSATRAWTGVASESKVAVIAALIANGVIAILKLVAGLAAGSSAMLSEAAHSFSDTGNQVLLMIGLTRSSSQPTSRYPFGKGKSAYFWPFMVAILLFGVAGTYSFIEGIDKIRHPHAIGDITLSLGVLGAAFVIEAISLGIAGREAKKAADRQGIASVRQFLKENRDATLLTVLVEDGLALVGLPIAAAALGLSVWTGDPVWDGIGSLVIGCLLMGFAGFLAWEIRELLIGRGLSGPDLDVVHRVLDEEPAVQGVGAVQSMYLGHQDVLLGVEVDLAAGLEGEVAEETVRRIEAALREALPVLRFVYVEPRDS